MVGNPPVYAGKLIERYKPMDKSKVKSTKTGDFAKGGPSGKMVGQQNAGTQKPGTTAHDTSDSGGDFAKGGSGHMVGRQSAGTAKPA